MIHYEIALAIIGITVTVLGIIIAFEITLPTKVFTEDYAEIAQFLFRWREEGISPPDDLYLPKHKEFTNLKEYLEYRLKELRKHVFLIFCGVGIIGVLIFQTFFWQVDPKTNQLNHDCFWFLAGSLIGAFSWILLLVFLRTYRYTAYWYGILLNEMKELEEQSSASETKNES